MKRLFKMIWLWSLTTSDGFDYGISAEVYGLLNELLAIVFLFFDRIVGYTGLHCLTKLNAYGVAAPRNVYRDTYRPRLV